MTPSGKKIKLTFNQKISKKSDLQQNNPYVKNVLRFVDFLPKN